MPNLKKELTNEQQILFNELKKLSKRANQRILRLERKYGKDSWATRLLKEKLETEPLQAWTKTGRVKVNKSMTNIQMEATIKATKEFLNNATSTSRGIKKAKQKAIKTLQTKFSSDVKDITYKEAEALTNFFEDKEVNGITNYIKGSDVLAIIEEAKEQNMSFENFYNTMNNYIIYNKGKGGYEQIIRNIYTKYVFKGNEEVEEINMLYDNISNSIDIAMTKNELEEIVAILDNLLYENKIDENEYNYLINKINEKWRQIEE